MAFNLKNLEQMPRSTTGNNFKYVTDDDRYTVSQAGYFDLSSVTLNNPGNATINCLCPNHSFVAIVSSDGDCLVKLADRTYQYFTADTIADVTASGYFAGKNYSFDADESIKVQAFDGPYEVQLVGGVASVVGGIALTVESIGYKYPADATPFFETIIASAQALAADTNASASIDLTGNYRFDTPLEITGGIHFLARNATFVVANNDCAVKIGNPTTGGFVNIDGTIHFTSEGASTGDGIQGYRGSFTINSIVGQDLNGWLIDCTTTQNLLNNSSITNAKSTNSGGLNFEVTGTRGSMEVEIQNVHVSVSLTESVKVSNLTDMTIVNAVCDTKNLEAKDCIVIDKVAGCKFGNLWGTSPDATGIVVTSDAFANTDAAYLTHFNTVGSTDSDVGVNIDARGCRFDMIRSVRSKGQSLIFGANSGQLSVGSIVLSNGSEDTGSTAMSNLSTRSIDIQTFLSESSNDLSAITIANSSNQMTIGTIQTVQATGGGSNTVWGSGVRPASLGNCMDADFVFKNKSSATTITGSGTFFNIPHGLSGTPQIYNVNLRNQAASFVTVTANATNIQVTLDASVTNPQFSWQAQIF